MAATGRPATVAYAVDYSSDDDTQRVYRACSSSQYVPLQMQGHRVPVILPSDQLPRKHSSAAAAPLQTDTDQKRVGCESPLCRRLALTAVVLVALLLLVVALLILFGLPHGDDDKATRSGHVHRKSDSGQSYRMGSSQTSQTQHEADVGLVYIVEPSSPSVQRLSVRHDGHHELGAAGVAVPQTGWSMRVAGHWRLPLLYLVGQHLYAADQANQLYIYDMHSKQWTKGPSLQAERERHSLNVLGNQLYACGCSRAACSHTCEVLALTEAGAPDGQWQTIDMATCGIGHAAAALDGRLYVAGGECPGERRQVAYLNASSLDWVPVASLPIHVQAHSAAALNGQLYVCGGWMSVNSRQSQVTDQCYEYNTQTNAWRPAARMSRPRVHFALVAVADRLLALGGGDGRSEIYDDVEEYSGQKRSWHTLPERLAKPTDELAADAMHHRS